MLLLPLTVAAQSTPRIEVFGGYSYLRLAQQTDPPFNTANLNGWNASIKLNVTQTFGLVADFSGHYEQGCAICVPLRPGDQHTFLAGAEFKLLHRGRFTVNLRALAGIMRQSNLFLPYLGLQFAYGGANLFAASLGGSVDYRISDRFSYRVIQPELLTTVSNAGGTLLAYPNAQVSTGLVFSFGKL
jgi:hypothetical protein